VPRGGPSACPPIPSSTGGMPPTPGAFKPVTGFSSSPSDSARTGRRCCSRDERAVSITSRVVLLTGSTGAVGRPLLHALLASPSIERVYALTHVDPLRVDDSRVQVVRGEITDGPGLGL